MHTSTKPPAHKLICQHGLGSQLLSGRNGNGLPFPGATTMGNACATPIGAAGGWGATTGTHGGSTGVGVVAGSPTAARPQHGHCRPIRRRQRAQATVWDGPMSVGGACPMGGNPGDHCNATFCGNYQEARATELLCTF